MSLTPGTRLGPYEIISPLGAGGMGEVYRARDSRLGREVAIKVLPEHLSASAEVRARFEREAKTVSSLNHPHICTLHDVGKEGETDYLVLELVDGETLATRLERGPLPLADVLRLGAQIADALDRAHRAGVVHRDLKPGNVMLTRSGAKLMDFGLARAVVAATPPGSSSPVGTVLTQAAAGAPLTAQGSLVGTFQYMAPEQLEGKDADARSDLWAFGCLLYEMATGKRAFDGPSQASLISAIMKDEPRPIAELVPMSPPALERLVRQCLAKDPEERWQSAGDVRRELQWIAGGSSAVHAAGADGAVTARRRRVILGLPPVAAAVTVLALVAAAAAVLWGIGQRGSAGHGLVRFKIETPAATRLGTPAEAALSPDGRTIAFLATDSLQTTHLYLRSLASREARVIPGTEDGALPFWSPDGRSLGFFSSGKLRKVALDGSAPVVLCDAPDARGGSWSKDGVIVFAPNNAGGLARVPANGGSPTPVTTIDIARKERGHRYPQFLPDGKHFLFVAVGEGDEMSTFASDLAGGKPVEVQRGGSGAVYVEPGYLLFLDTGINSPQRRLLARRFDAGSRRASGDAQLVLDRVNANNFGYSNVVASASGTLVTQRWGLPHWILRWRDRTGARAATVSENFGDGSTFGLSPDGRRMAFGGGDTGDLGVLDLVTGVSTRLTFANQDATAIVWSPDGQRIAFARLLGQRGFEIHVKHADGSGPDSTVFHGPGLFSNPLSWSPDGRWLVADCSDSTGNHDLWLVPMAGDGAPAVFEHTPEQEFSAFISPDGRWVAYSVAVEGKQQSFVQSFPTPGSKYQVNLPDAGVGGWSPKGDELWLGNRQGEVITIPVSTSGGLAFGAPRRLFQLPADEFPIGASPDGQRLLTAQALDVAAGNWLEVALDWRELLGKK